MSVELKRAYDPPTTEDGYRVLVDRIWPRGRPKDDMHIDEWMKDIAPSNYLRKSFHSSELAWGQFRRHYLAELKHHRDQLRPLAQHANRGKVTLVFSAHDREHNNAVVLRQYLKMLRGR